MPDLHGLKPNLFVVVILDIIQHFLGKRKARVLRQMIIRIGVLEKGLRAVVKVVLPRDVLFLIHVLLAQGNIRLRGRVHAGLIGADIIEEFIVGAIEEEIVVCDGELFSVDTHSVRALLEPVRLENLPRENAEHKCENDRAHHAGGDHEDLSLARLTLLPGGFFCCRGFFCDLAIVLIPFRKSRPVRRIIAIGEQAAL